MHKLGNLLCSLSLIALPYLTALTGNAADFDSRFQEIVHNATDEQLYRFLYALPKGGDLHNHQDGANWPDWWYRVATDPAKTHGDTFYTLTNVGSPNPSGGGPLFYTTIPKWQYDRLPESDKSAYQPLSSLDPATKANWHEINLISNKLLGYVPNFADHPFPRDLRFGIPVCLNTDRGMWGSTMTDEYFVAVKNFNLLWDEVVQLGRNSLEYSFAQPDQKQRLLNSYNQAVREFEQKYAGDWRALVAAVNATGSPYAEREFGIKLPPP